MAERYTDEELNELARRSGQRYISWEEANRLFATIIALEQELVEIPMTHAQLDELHVPRQNEHGVPFSLVGRIDDMRREYEGRLEDWGRASDHWTSRFLEAFKALEKANHVIPVDLDSLPTEVAILVDRVDRQRIALEATWKYLQSLGSSSTCDRNPGERCPPDHRHGPTELMRLVSEGLKWTGDKFYAKAPS